MSGEVIFLVQSHLKVSFNGKIFTEALRQLEHVRMSAKFPKEEDFFGAAQALVRLQDTYELNMTQLARGNLWGRQTRAGELSQPKNRSILTELHDCFVLTCSVQN